MLGLYEVTARSLVNRIVNATGDDRDLINAIVATCRFSAAHPFKQGPLPGDLRVTQAPEAATG
jgi:hypothetical protein